MWFSSAAAYRSLRPRRAAPAHAGAFISTVAALTKPALQ